MLQILYTDLNKEFHKTLMDELRYDFPQHFFQKVNRFKRWQDAQASILGRLLLKKGCGMYDINLNQHQVITNENEKPYLKTNKLKFNISHSGNIVVCAISETHEVGIDIELIKHIEISDFRGQMTKNEWEEVINSQNQNKSFFDYWTKKEAVLKALGKGLNVPLKSFEVRMNKTLLEGKSFYLSNLTIHTDYSCHLASTSTPDLLTSDIMPIQIKELIAI